MPSVPTPGSPNIAVLDSQIIADLCVGKFYVDATPSTYIGSGAENVLGANVQITNPLGVVVKPYGTNYEIAPDLSGGMDAVISFNIPTVANNYMYGVYTVAVKLFDADGTSWVVEKSVKVCQPNSLDKTKKYGTISASLIGKCKEGRMVVLVDNVPTYNGVVSTTQSNDFTLEYPTGSEVVPLASANLNFSTWLFEGVYKITGTVCATYPYGDNIYAKVNYKLNTEKNVKCSIDYCCISQQLAALDKRLNTDCSEKEKVETANIILDTLRLVKTAELAGECGEDPSDYIAQLEVLLGCSCTCNCNPGTPITGAALVGDYSIEGCNITKTVVANSTVYTINNYAYIVSLVNNGGAITLSAPQLDGCTYTQQLTFDISKVYEQIKSQINSQTEKEVWASIINASLNGLDVSCLSISVQQWATMTFRQRFEQILNAICRLGCTDVSITDVTVTNNGTSITWSWTTNGQPHSIEIYLNDEFVGSVLGTETSFVLNGNFFNDQTFSYRITPKCKVGYGTAAAGSFETAGRAFVAPPQVFTPYLNGSCPYDLTTNVMPLPLGVNAEWHSQDNTLAATLVADPTNALQGVYFVFAKDSEGNYSESVQVQLVCNVSGSCSAPQNLTVVPIFGGSQIRFQSAGYPPPLNSYTVKRRLQSDPDIAGSYTTIGTPVWNSGISRWVITDGTAVPNVLYVYRAISNCGGTSPYIDSEYANIQCPVVTLTPYASDIAYSFVGVGGEISKYEVSIYEPDGVTLVHTNTHLPSFPNPITGRFLYLDANTRHYVVVKAFIGTYSHTCPAQAMDTLPDTATLTIDYIAGIWSGVLSSPLSANIYLQPATTVATGSNDDCATPFETDTMPAMTLEAGELSVESETADLSYLSEKYKINDLVFIKDGADNPLYEAAQGGTFVVDGITVTVIINHTECGYYPA